MPDKYIHPGKPHVSSRRIFTVQVCVPKDWTIEQAREFAEKEDPCGISAGWQASKREGCQPGICEENPDFQHILFDA